MPNNLIDSQLPIIKSREIISGYIKRNSDGSIEITKDTYTDKETVPSERADVEIATQIAHAQAIVDSQNAIIAKHEALRDAALAEMARWEALK